MSTLPSRPVWWVPGSYFQQSQSCLILAVKGSSEGDRRGNEDGGAGAIYWSIICGIIGIDMQWLKDVLERRIRLSDERQEHIKSDDSGNVLGELWRR